MDIAMPVAVDDKTALEMFSDELILNYDPLVEHFKSRQEAFKRNNPFYTDFDYDIEKKESVCVKETPDGKVFLVKTRVAAKPDNAGNPLLEEYVITEFDGEGLTDYALLEKGNKIWDSYK